MKVLQCAFQNNISNLITAGLAKVYIHTDRVRTDQLTLIRASLWQHKLLKQLFEDGQAKYSNLISHKKVR